MGSADLYVQMGISHCVTDLLKGTSCSKHSEGAAEGDLSGGSDASCDTYHVSLCNTAVKETIRICFLKYACLGCSCKVRIQYDYVRVLCAKLF